MGEKHVHVEDGQGWTKWHQEEVDAVRREDPQYKGARVVYAKLCGGCGDMMAERIEYE